MEWLVLKGPEAGRSTTLRTVGQVLVLVLGLVTVYLVYTAVYNAFFHPLRKIPGPKLSAITRIPYTRMQLSGNPHRDILKLHNKYGPVVRIAPQTVSISHPDAMKQLRGHKSGKPEHGKDPIHQMMNGHNILGANREDHARFRRSMSHGFSAQSMLEQQPLIIQYVDLLIERLHAQSERGAKKLDIVSWYNFTTFDVIGDLAFGESFNCLEASAYHPWVSLIFDSVKYVCFASNIRRYTLLAPFYRWLVPQDLQERQRSHDQLSEAKVRKRLENNVERPDFISSMTKSRGTKSADMTFEELTSNASVLVIAGSETTATLLSAATYYLAANPQTLACLVDEVRTSFTSEGEIDLISTQNLRYMQAVLDEAFRKYPPVPSGSPRITAPDGDEIAGHFIPGDTAVEIWQYALYHNPALFTKAEEFIPERWLGDPQFENDVREAVQPFSVGPRNCIGRNLAYSEMRLILARMIWNFDIRLAPESTNWAAESQTFFLWAKKPLYVYLTPSQKA